ncbi:hypothetical protein NECID01_0131 [Nematocida sp. AWRm77]|nr:hypothetical protein NECID01_0131 [Nematocida sp. AWRm77]
MLPYTNEANTCHTLHPGTFEHLPLDHITLCQILQRNRSQDLSVVLYGHPEREEEKLIMQKIEEAGICARFVLSEEKKMVVKLKQHMKFVVLKIEAV